MTMTDTIPRPERKLTEAERAEEDARTGRALAGQPRPRTLHALCEQSARLVRCGQCGQKPGRACSDAGGVDGYHLDRFLRAIDRELITAERSPSQCSATSMCSPSRR
jgi:hypothetical protein